MVRPAAIWHTLTDESFPGLRSLFMSANTIVMDWGGPAQALWYSIQHGGNSLLPKTPGKTSLWNMSESARK